MTPPIIITIKIFIGLLVFNKNKKILASKIIKKLNKYGIGARPFFWPMSEQNIFKMKIFKKIIIQILNI